MTESEPQSAVEASKPEKKSSEELEKLDKKDLIATINKLYDYLDAPSKTEDIQALRESEEKCKQQLNDATRRESMLLKTLTEKEREINDLAAQIEELKQYQLPSNNQLRTMLLEPTVNVVINRLRKELDSTKQRLEESQSELNAWKFTQDSQTGKQLMARCRTLLKENEELGKQISQGRIAKLEGEIALQKKLVEEMKVAQKDTEQFAMELDDDTEALQATIYLLQTQLKEAKDRIDALEGMNTVLPNTDQQKTNENSNTNSCDEPMEQEAVTLTSENSGLLTQADKPLTSNKPASSNVVMNGVTEEADVSEEALKSEKVTTSSVVDSNGHKQMLVTS